MGKNYKKIIISCISVYVFVYISYLLLSNGLADKEIYLQMRRFIPCIISMGLLLYITNTTLICKASRTSLIVGLSWILVIPVTYYITYKDSATFISNHFDMAFGLYIFTILSSIKYIIDVRSTNYKLFNVTFTFLQFILLLIPIFALIYFGFYQSVISYNGLLAIYQTNIPEAIEYLKSLPLSLMFFVLVFLILLFICFYKYNIKERYIYANKSFKIHYIAIVLLGIISFYAFFNLLFKTYVVSTAVDVKNYFNSIKKYDQFHKENFDSLYVNNKNNLKKPYTIVLVIGESESRDLMHCYVGDKVRENTPWFDKQKNNPNFIFFENAYACWIQTVPVLERALTEKNQYNDLEFSKSFSIVDIAKKAGFKTYWFSNQGYMGDADTPITIVGQSSDIAKWTVNEDNVIQYDESLLQFINDIDPNENNFVVFHLMGCHANYESRYPEERMIWGKDNYTLLDGNDNSIAYTDYVLSEIYNRINNKTNLAAMIYFSDHGSDPKIHRHPDKLNYYGIHIPLVVYLSDQYVESNSDIVNNFLKNKESYFTNDLIYNFVCSVLNVESNHFNEKESLGSSSYMYDKYSLKMMLGKMSLAEDETKN